jgi:hypothetical protein
MTALLLVQIFAALTATILRDYLQKNTEDVAERTWNACILRPYNGPDRRRNPR